MRVNRREHRVKNWEKKDVNTTCGEINDAAVKIHSALGPVLPESGYVACPMPN